jgi:hypothetical protein
MPGKPIKQGYKVFGIADHGYLYNWIWSSREKGLQEILYFLNLTNIGCLVQILALSLLYRYLIIYFENYFILIPLFIELRACDFNTIGTTRPYKEFLSQLVELKTRFATKLE